MVFQGISRKEDLFRRNIKSVLNKNGIQVDRIEANLHGTKNREYDLIAVNGKEVYVFDIKSRLKKHHINKFFLVQLPEFKNAFPEFNDLTLYGGMGALVVKDSMEEIVFNHGLYLMTQNDSGGATLHQPDQPKIM